MISVVICTRDRAAKLARCLEHFAATADAGNLAWQLVVVDNASSDGTKAVVDRYKTRLPIAYAYEARRGLSNARNRGVAEARHPIVAFTDDDCLPAPDWLRAIAEEFAAHPHVAVLGGRVVLDDGQDHRMSLRAHDHTERVSSAERILALMSGCNMAFRRSVFDRVGLFDPLFGKGVRVGSAEEIDILYRALRAGVDIAYVPAIVVRHAHGRDTSEEIESVAREYVRGRGAFYRKFIGDRQIARMAYWEVTALLRETLHGKGAAKVLRGLAAGALYQSLTGRGASRATAGRAEM
jgi:glycosyltransferase involved in cell wall biosynthesis